jgi:hypothetical protein
MKFSKPTVSYLHAVEQGYSSFPEPEGSSPRVSPTVLGGNKLNKLLIDFLWHFWAPPTLDMHSPHILGRLIPASREKCSTVE